ncbi:hypothetical protein [Mucilaginibacter jinjuensis]|uniref:Uncharacterized protein n=1 Tax=Mucilaginibacter jinjuensis TaxID=1176721 RepID=A0ABY7T2S1_9SPHI|nr:hypothetical protein [Mucilaginibacter jinjuensis]WCT10697.1 hypothetical protein PQO05_18330 [Mucilaginibacter jinjuensis]
MNDLLKLTLDAHGGIEAWKRFKSISAELKVRGVAWELRQQTGVLDNINVTVSTDRQFATFYPFVKETWHNTFEPDRVSIMEGNKTIEAMDNPRASFAGFNYNDPWSLLQLTYFSGYAIWNYLCAPFFFADPAFKVAEIEPWQENGKVYRCLQVTFPKHLATHSRVEKLYINEDGLIDRLDYEVEVVGNTAAANYIENYIIFQGIKFGTKRRVYMRQEDNTPKLPSPELIAIDMSNIVLR